MGQNVRKYGGKLLIKPSKKNLKSFLNKVRSTIEANKTVTAAKLTTSLNPMIRVMGELSSTQSSQRGLQLCRPPYMAEDMAMVQEDAP
ncbi:hypothetical protein M5J15_04875 [Serratia symbiotica]|uniref:hypothetical protein n=1 Tax=Serratia symbiotica TaxID=138074 RepID=UPI001DC268AF|nr:hypothetical protein [Serratia symbiotica]NIG88384.1 hypothetical protein [Serratia symbiotica]USS96345.1 hypothetical protein M5J15_04875 [Serratia symbiotica]